MENGQYVEIQGEYVAVREQITHRVVLFSDWIKEIQKRSFSANSGILPTGCKLWLAKTNETWLVIEQPPKVRNTRWKIKETAERSDWHEAHAVWREAYAVWHENRNAHFRRRHDAAAHNEPFNERFTEIEPREPVRYTETTTNTTHKLAFPFCIFSVHFINDAVNKLYLHYRNAPLSTLDDELYFSNVPNVYRPGSTMDAQVCTGEIRAQGTTIGQRAESLVTAFWASTFNQDLINNFYAQHAVHPTFALAESDWKKGREAWEQASKEDPLFVLQTKWNKHKTLKELVGV